MLRSIYKWVVPSKGFEAATGLSIDTNPTLDEIVLKRWPGLKISRAIYRRWIASGWCTWRTIVLTWCIRTRCFSEHVPKPWLAGAELVRVLKREAGDPYDLRLQSAGMAKLPRFFNDYYRFFPDGLAELFRRVEVLVKEGWGNREAILYNVGVDDGHGRPRRPAFPSEGWAAERGESPVGDVDYFQEEVTC